MILNEESKVFYLKNEPLIRLYWEITPLRRMGRAGEVACIIRLLTSSDASFVTGHEIVVDGDIAANALESTARRLLQNLIAPRRGESSVNSHVLPAMTLTDSACLHRTTCRLCGSSDVAVVLPMVPTPVADDYVSRDRGAQLGRRSLRRNDHRREHRD